MIHSLRSAALATLVALLPAGLSAQGVVVDEGSFRITLDGEQVGTEDFTIRRAGVGRGEAFFATATVRLRRDEGQQEIELILRASPPEGLPACTAQQATCYQVEVSGPDAMTLLLTRAGQRYGARITSEIGEEIREFSLEPDLRLLELDVAHLYYFLRDASAGSVTPVLEPRTRSRFPMTTDSVADEMLTVGSVTVLTQRVEFSSNNGRRIVWYDRQGRVVRVSIPARGYVAERTDLVG